MRLRVLADYRERGVNYREGTEIEVPDIEGEHLLSDSPGSFCVDAPEPEPEQKARKRPARNKAVQGAPKDK